MFIHGDKCVGSCLISNVLLGFEGVGGGREQSGVVLAGWTLMS